MALEGQQLLTDVQDAATDSKKSLSATELRKEGIHFWRMNRIWGFEGSRGINFKNSMWFCRAFPFLFLPPFLIGDDTELTLQCVRNYEMSQNLDKSKQEVGSYLLFVSELIQRSEDAKLIYSKGIIQGKHKLKLPEILRRLAPKESYNHNLRRVKRQSFGKLISVQTKDYFLFG